MTENLSEKGRGSTPRQQNRPAAASPGMGARIVSKRELAPKIYEMVVEAPRLARKAQPGHFVIVMADERGERVPLTIADFDRTAGTITLVLMVVGTSSMKLSRLEAGRVACTP